MIKKLHVKNFTSLRDVKLELGQRNVLVGPNMSGKTNLIGCLRFLAHMTLVGLNKAILDRGGFSEIAWKGGDEDRISFHLTGESPEENKIYEYEITILGSTSGAISVEREHLVVKGNGQISTLIDLQNGRGKVMHANGTAVFDPKALGQSQSALEFSVPGWEGTDLKKIISSWRFYQLVPAIMKQANQMADTHSLTTPHGDNFTQWFMKLKTSYDKEFRMIKQAAQDALPELEEILTIPTQAGMAYMASREKHLRRQLTMWQMSDGELVFLAYLSLIFAPPGLGAPLFCVEEVENHLHPKLLEMLIEMLMQRQNTLGPEAAQIIITTHSPHVVDRVNLDELIVVEKRQGGTQCTRPADKRHLKELLEREELGLGDLWYSGALSGN